MQYRRNAISIKHYDIVTFHFCIMEDEIHLSDELLKGPGISPIIPGLHITGSLDEKRELNNKMHIQIRFVISN